MTPEEIREFEKAPKSLIKMKGSELLFEDDAIGKMKYIYDAFENEADLNKAAAEVLASEDGAKHLIRALNNLKTIPHAPAMRFAHAVYSTVLPELDLLARVQKCQQILDNISETFEGDTAWLDAELISLLNTLKDDAATYVILWSAWVGANLRSMANSGKLISEQAPKRLQSLSKTVFNQLVRTMNDPEENWEYAAAAMYALVGARAMRMDDAQRFIETAYNTMPLEALSGIEALSMALEMDAANYAESDAIAEKLSQVRRDHLILRDMNRDSFEAAAKRLFENQNEIPDEALDIALQLPSLDKNDRMMATILIDDARRSDFIQMALKTQTLRTLSKTFFDHITVENPIVRAFSIPLVLALSENCNLSALLVDKWIDACENSDVDALKAELDAWKAAL